MSALEFIVAIKWPVVVLIVLVVACYGMRRLTPGTRRTVLDSMLNREVSAKVPGVELVLGAPGELVSTALATDAQIAEHLSPGNADPSAAIQNVRQQVIEDLAKLCARAGWSSHDLGSLSYPDVSVEWEGGTPAIAMWIETEPGVRKKWGTWTRNDSAQ